METDEMIRQMRDLIATLRDAFETEKRRADKAEAACAAMRVPLAMHAEVRRAEHFGELHAGGIDRGCECRWCLTSRALATDARRDITASVCNADSRADEAKAVFCDFVAVTMRRAKKTKYEAVLRKQKPGVES